MKKKLGTQKGFTLIELLVVAAIIGILAAVGVVAYNGYTKSAKINATKTAYQKIEKRLLSAITGCMSGIDVKFYANSSIPDCSSLAGGPNADNLTWQIYGESVKHVQKFENPYDKNIKGIEWSNGTCPPPNPPKGQIILGYGYKNNCGFPGNISCIKANIGDNDGNDVYLSKEFDFCKF